MLPDPRGTSLYSRDEVWSYFSKDFPTLFVFGFDGIFDSQKFSHYSQVY